MSCQALLILNTHSFDIWLLPCKPMILSSFTELTDQIGYSTISPFFRYPRDGIRCDNGKKARMLRLCSYRFIFFFFFLTYRHSSTELLSRFQLVYLPSTIMRLSEFASSLSGRFHQCNEALSFYSFLSS